MRTVSVGGTIFVFLLDSKWSGAPSLQLVSGQQEVHRVGETNVFASHVMEGNRKGINFETEIPYGEDLDGDGEVDKRRRGGGNRRGGRGQ